MLFTFTVLLKHKTTGDIINIDSPFDYDEADGAIEDALNFRNENLMDKLGYGEYHFSSALITSDNGRRMIADIDETGVVNDDPLRELEEEERERQAIEDEENSRIGEEWERNNESIWRDYIRSAI